jgi:hypothetical protein
MKIKFNLIFLVVALLAACHPSTPKTEAPKVETYTSKEIGWTIDIPKGFQSMSKNRIEANEEKGRQAIEKASGTAVLTDSLIHLVNFQKNQFNSFMATIERFNEAKDGNYNEHNESIKKLIFDTYTHQNIKVDTLSGKEMIGKVPFNSFHIKIYGPNGEVIMNQIMYSTLTAGYDFGAAINYNNEVDKKTLIDAFKNSEFVGNTN